MKRRENQEILERIRYLKTKCICRLYCTGLNQTIWFWKKTTYSWMSGPPSTYNFLFRFEERLWRINVSRHKNINIINLYNQQLWSESMIIISILVFLLHPSPRGPRLQYFPMLQPNFRFFAIRCNIFQYYIYISPFEINFGCTIWSSFDNFRITIISHIWYIKDSVKFFVENKSVINLTVSVYLSDQIW